MHHKRIVCRAPLLPATRTASVARRAGVSPAADGRPRPAVGTKSTRDCQAETLTPATPRYDIHILFAFGNPRRAGRHVGSRRDARSPPALLLRRAPRRARLQANDSVPHLIFDFAELSEPAIHAAVLREKTWPGPMYFLDNGILDHCTDSALILLLPHKQVHTFEHDANSASIRYLIPIAVCGVISYPRP